MLVKFKQAVHLKGKDGKGKDYSRGTHEVPQSHLESSHFHKLMKAGLVEDGEDARAVPALSFLDRQKKLAETLSKPKAKSKAQPSAVIPSQGQSAAAPAEPTEAPEAPVAPPAGEPSSDDQLPPEKSEDEQLAEMEAEEAKVEKAKSKKQKGK